MDLAREYLNMIPGMNDAEKFSSEKQKMIIRRIKSEESYKSRRLVWGGINSTLISRVQGYWFMEWVVSSVKKSWSVWVRRSFDESVLFSYSTQYDATLCLLIRQSIFKPNFPRSYVMFLKNSKAYTTCQKGL